MYHSWLIRNTNLNPRTVNIHDGRCRCTGRETHNTSRHLSCSHTADRLQNNWKSVKDLLISKNQLVGLVLNYISSSEVNHMSQFLFMFTNFAYETACFIPWKYGGGSL
jgi:hypothetical protein